MNRDELSKRLPNASFAFRGYNVTNLGRSHELLVHPKYGEIVHSFLREASNIYRDVIGHRVDLVRRVREERETHLRSYGEALALIVAMEMAQLKLLEEFFDVTVKSAKSMMGYSLGEIAALVAGGVIDLHSALTVPLTFANDCVQLAKDVSLGVLFSRGDELSLDDVQRLLVEINTAGKGIIGMSAILSPNSVLLMGQQKTLAHLKQLIHERLPSKTYLRLNSNRWPPLHTPITWQCNIPTRVAVLMHTMNCKLAAPEPPILSMVTGKASYNDYNVREILRHWTDSPQRLWDVVYQSLAIGVQTIVHVGPQPNIIPATFKRLHDNVEAQTKGSIGMRALSVVVRRPWLSHLLPEKAALLKVLNVEHVVLEDWLLEQKFE